MSGKLSIAEFEKKWMGRRVRSSVGMRRREAWNPQTQRIDKVWEEAPSDIVGWVVGCRWKQNGYSFHLGYEDGLAWRSLGVVPCVLVAPGANRKPIPVPLRCLEVM